MVTKWKLALLGWWLLAIVASSGISPGWAATKRSAKKAAPAPRRSTAPAPKAASVRFCNGPGIVATPIKFGEGKVTSADKPVVMATLYPEVGALWCTDENVEYTVEVFWVRVEDERFPDTAYGVAVQPGQYGRLSKTGLRVPEPQTPRQWEAYRRLEAMVDKKLRGEFTEVYYQRCIFQALFPQGQVVKVVPNKNGRGRPTYFGR